VVSNADPARCCRAFSQASTHLILSVLDRCERTDLASANRADPPIAHVHQPGAKQIRRHVNLIRPITTVRFVEPRFSESAGYIMDFGNSLLGRI
jgi:hypothetical protein